MMKGKLYGTGQRMGLRMAHGAGYIAMVVIWLILWSFQASQGMGAKASFAKTWIDAQFRPYHMMRQGLEELHTGPIHTLWESVVEYPLLTEREIRKEWEMIQRDFEAIGIHADNRGERSFSFTLTKGLTGIVAFHEVQERPDAYGPTLIVKLETKEEITPAEEERILEMLNMLKKKHEDPYIYTCMKAVDHGTLNTLRTRLISILSKKMKGTWGEFYQDQKSWSARISGEDSLQVMLHERTGDKGTEIILGTPYIATEF